MEATNSVSNPIFAGLGEDLLRFNKKQKYFIFDTETCHLNLVWEDNVPWEYGWIIATQDEILEEKEYLVKWPKINISPEAAKVTNFYAKEPRIATEGVEPQWLLQEFEKRLFDPELIPVAHNGLGFDIYMHAIHRRKLGLAPDWRYIDRVIDTNTIARAFKLGVPIPVRSQDTQKFLAFQYRMYAHVVRGVKTSIKTLAPEWGFEYDPLKAHAASYDCVKLMEILKYLINHSEI
jgi:DNA polymerase III epsilon subunit-like protein